MDTKAMKSSLFAVVMILTTIDRISQIKVSIKPRDEIVSGAAPVPKLSLTLSPPLSRQNNTDEV